MKQSGPVGAGLVPVGDGQGRSVPIGGGRCRSGPVGTGDYRYRPVSTGAADRPQETLYLAEKKNSTFFLVRVPPFGQKWTKIFLQLSIPLASLYDSFLDKSKKCSVKQQIMISY
jgi:hypothetical protein